ncbi:MAG: rhodanese-like domain-containing protein [Deltaproteobacteria bacterium]|nr:rhodanese-like domain-containing protein [Deltaproteobacteria bacterium]
MYRLDWLASLERSPAGVPMHPPTYVARQGRGVRVIDLREADELLGPLGYVPGSDWVPQGSCDGLAARLDAKRPVILVSGAGERSSVLAARLEQAGLEFVACMRGGMLAWVSGGYRSTRDPEILQRRGQLRDAPRLTMDLDGELTRAEIEAHIGDPSELQWVKLAAVLLHAHRSCVDGRGDMGVIGTPGGDVGELVLALHALERFLGCRLEPETVDALVERVADAMGNLYMHTDTQARDRLIATLMDDPRLSTSGVEGPLAWWRWLAAPPEHLRPLVLEHLLTAEHVGCGHLRLMLEHREDYGVRPDLVREVISAFTNLRWRGAAQLELVVLPGGHDEAAVLDVHVEGDLHGTSAIPLIAPRCAEGQMFVNHPQVAAYVRHELAAVLSEQTDLVAIAPPDRVSLGEIIDLLGEEQVQVTLGFLARGLPIFDVQFRRDGSVQIIEAGHVGSDALPE